MSGAVTIKTPFMQAWKEFGWPKDTKGYGINDNLYNSDGDVTINYKNNSFVVTKENRKKHARLHKPKYGKPGSEQWVVPEFAMNPCEHQWISLLAGFRRCRMCNLYEKKEETQEATKEVQCVSPQDQAA